MVAIKVESVENDSPAKNREDSSHALWNNSQTHRLIAYFKNNSILSWDQIEVTQLKEFGIEIHGKAKRMIPVKQQHEHYTDGCHLVFPCARAVVVSDWLNF